ncbi:hypothetical protein JW935_02140 [candidate division KSB1 bacterium]|nr:hypothetical protein [candidate division KSB1 bacterium]
MNNKRMIMMSLLMLSFLAAHNVMAQVSFSGDVTGVSTYVFRGVKQNNGPAMQGTASATISDLVSIGLWYSSVDFGGEEDAETDPFVEVALPFGLIAGTTFYSYNMLKTYNSSADVEIEAYVKYSLSPVDLALYYVPSQASMDAWSEMDGYSNKSVYWIDVSAGIGKFNLDWGLGLGYGTYSSRFTSTLKDDAVGCATFSIGKTISESVSAGWNYTLSLDDDMDDTFYASVSLSF